MAVTKERDCVRTTEGERRSTIIIKRRKQERNVFLKIVKTKTNSHVPYSFWHLPLMYRDLEGLR